MLVLKMLRTDFFFLNFETVTMISICVLFLFDKKGILIYIENSYPINITKFLKLIQTVL